MLVTVTREQLDGVWAALNAPLVAARSYRVRGSFDQALKDQWTHQYQLEDIISDTDGWLNDFAHRVGLKKFSETLGFQWTNIAGRPRQRSNSVVLHGALRVAELAALLIK